MKSHFFPSVSSDSCRWQPELFEAYGYPSETHKIKTEDGYFLEVHRMAAPGKQPVILMHGMLDSSATYVILGPGKALGAHWISINFYFQSKKFNSWKNFKIENSYQKWYSELNFWIFNTFANERSHNWIYAVIGQQVNRFILFWDVVAENLFIVYKWMSQTSCK